MLLAKFANVWANKIVNYILLVKAEAQQKSLKNQAARQTCFSPWSWLWFYGSLALVPAVNFLDSGWLRLAAYLIRCRAASKLLARSAI